MEAEPLRYFICAIGDGGHVWFTRNPIVGESDGRREDNLGKREAEVMCF